MKPIHRRSLRNDIFIYPVRFREAKIKELESEWRYDKNIHEFTCDKIVKLHTEMKQFFINNDIKRITSNKRNGNHINYNTRHHYLLYDIMLKSENDRNLFLIYFGDWFVKP